MATSSTHRVAISNRRLIALNERSIAFKVKDYRIEGPGRYTTMTLEIGEFIRRFPGHVLPKGFHRILHRTFGCLQADRPQFDLDYYARAKTSLARTD